MTTAHVEPTLQDLPDGPGPLTEANDGQIMRWDASQGRMVMIAIPRPVVLSSAGGGGGSGGGPQAPHNHDALYAPVSHNHDGVYALVGHTHEGGDDHDHDAFYAPANHNHDDRYVMLADYTAADVLSKLLTVDGTGSGLDADTLDGLNSDAFAEAGHTHDTSHDHDADYAPLVHTHAGEDITSGTVADDRIASTITRDSEVFGIVLVNDGAGSGLDADLLDGLNSDAFALAGHNHAHNDLTGLTTGDPHTQYVLLAGRAGGQVISGNVLFNQSSVLAGALGSALVQIGRDANGLLLLHRESNDSGGATLELLKRRSSFSVVSANDRIGTIVFSGADGSVARRAADIYVEIDSSPGSNDMPGRLVLATTPSGSGTPVEAIRIRHNQRVGFGVSPTARLHAVGQGNETVFLLECSATDGSTFDLEKVKAGSFLFDTGTVFSSGSVGHAPIYALRRARNTVASPQAVASGDRLGAFGFRGYDGSAFQQRALLDTVVDGSVSSGTVPTAMLFLTGASSATEQMRITSAGNVGIGTSAPQGRLHGHDGTGGFGHFTKTGIVGSAQTIIPDGTGDVVRGVTVTGVARTTDGAFIRPLGPFVVANGGSAVVDLNPPAGTDTLTFAVAANGAFTVARSGGTKTYEISVWLTWL